SHSNVKVGDFVNCLKDVLSEKEERENIKWYALLDSQKIYPGIKASNITENILWEYTEARKSEQEEIYATVCLLFQVMNDYINNITMQLESHKFFDPRQYDSMLREFHVNAVLHSNIKSHSLLKTLEKWMGIITQEFVDINEQRRKDEENVSKKIIDRVIDI